MTKIVNILSYCRAKGISLSIDDSGTNLKVKGNLESLSAEEKENIRQNKQEIIALLRNATGTAYSTIAPVKEQEFYPLSSAQRRLWIVSQYDEANIAYNVPVFYTVKGIVDRHKLALFFTALINRHEILRTVFRPDRQGEIGQMILTSDPDFDLSYTDLRDKPDKHPKAGEMIREEMIRPFDLAQGPLLRASLFQTAEDEWIFAYVMHHIICDGWSMNILNKELSLFFGTNYSSAAAPPLRIQYKDYAAWQQEQVKGGRLKAHRDFWLNKFSGELPVLELPGDYARPGLKTFNGSILINKLSPELTKALKMLGHEQGATPFMGLLSVVYTLLYRYTHQKDIIIGSSVAGREHRDLEDQIGFYVNTLALRAQFDGTDSYRQLLSNVKQLTLDAYAHQVYPFDELIEELPVQRDRSRSALFDVMVVLLDDGAGSSKEQMLGDLTFTRIEEELSLTSKFDLLFSFGEAGEGTTFSIEYNTDIYRRDTIERMADHVVQLAEVIVKQPDLPIDSLYFLNDAEKTDLLSAFNDTARPFPADKTVVDLFGEQATKSPENKAVCFEGKDITYKELDELSNQLGHYLKARYPIRPDNLIGIKLERNESFIVAMIGVLKSGAACLPIDPDYPAERISFMERDSDCLVTIDASFYEQFFHERTTVSISPLPRAARPGNLVYVIYTSGSTGRPKGIMMTHKAMVNLIHFQVNDFPGSKIKSVLQFASISFDVSFQEIFFTLLKGAALYPVPEETKKDTGDLVDFIGNHRIDTVFLPTAYFKLLMEDEYFLTHIGATVRHIIVAGEQLMVGASFLRLLESSDLTLHNHYGPAETHVVTTCRISKENPAELKAIPSIGRPVDNHAIYILNDQHLLMPVGTIGEIYIRGAGLARGYLNQPDMTREKFIADPYKEGEKMYKTGDLGRWQADGSIAYAGRKDFQVKIRGYRIEPGEIEWVLERHPLIKTAIVLAIEQANGDKSLVAYVVERQAAVIADPGISDHDLQREWKNYLADKLPAYMRPDHFIRLAAIPLTPNGKLDKKRLPSPTAPGSPAGIPYVPARNTTEEKLVSVWQQILGKERIGIRDDFFESGGHSLKATRLVSRIHKEFGVKLTLKDLFRYPVLEDQAQCIKLGANASFTPILPVARKSAYPLSSAQRRLWILSQFEAGSIAYNLAGVYVLEGALNREALSVSFDTLISRHESLRTIFKENDKGEINQFILSPEEMGFSIRSEDHRCTADQQPAVNEQTDNGKHTTTQEEYMKSLVQQECIRPFDLSAGPLIRAGLYQLSDDKWIFTFVMHHIISDGWSMNVLIRELKLLYNAYCGNEKDPLPPLRIHYKDYAAWQQDWLKEEGAQLHKAYWLAQFSGELPVLDLPGDKPRPAVKTYNGGSVTAIFDAAVSRKLKDFCRDQKASLFMGLLAAVNVLFYRYTNQEDLITGTPASGREHADLEDQIGFYVSTLAIRTRFRGDNNFTELLGIVKELTLQSFERQAYPFDELVDVLELKRDRGRSPLFDVMVALQHAGGDKAEDGDWGPLIVKKHSGILEVISQFDLTFLFEESENALQVRIGYNSDIFYEDTITRMAGHVAQLLQLVLEQPAVPIHQLDYLTAAEKQQLLMAFNDTAVNYPQDQTMADLFVRQVRATPHHIALVFEDAHLTYQELNEKANELVNYWRSNDTIREGDLVGVMLGRSEWMIISLLAILKSGAAYVPIDPFYPPARKAFVIRDTGISLLIAQEKDSAHREYHQGAVFYIGDWLALSNNAPVPLKGDPSEPPVPAIRPDSLAYVMYTSGSTGSPKGVMVGHNSVIRLVKSANYADLTADRTLLSTGSVSFDATTFEYWGMLLNGGKLILCPEESLLDEQKLAGLIIENKVDIMWFTAGWLNQLVEKNIEIFRGLKTMLAGGEKLSSVHIKKLQTAYPDLQIINGYGPTENTTFSLTYPIDRRPDALPENIPVGKPIHNSTAYIMDAQGYLAPVGITGEIVVGGQGLALGYLNDAPLTAQKFISNPFKPGERLYKTGDLGRWLPDGNIAFMGRNDELVKIRGYRIELGEIENTLQKYPGMDAAVVIARPNPEGGKDLIAYMVSGNTLRTTDIRSWLAMTLPAYMLPAYFVQLDRLPLSSNGKVDKKRLPDPADLSISSGIEFVAPRNGTEEKLAAVWQEILGRGPIGVKDDFFELGGHSLKITRLASRIVKEFDVKLTVGDLFANPVMEDQACLVMNAKKTPFLSIAPARVQSCYPLSPSQRRLWVLSQFEEGNIAYNVPGAYVLEGSLNRDALTFAFNRLIARHEILRTVFREDSRHEVKQFISSPQEDGFRIKFLDLRQEVTPEEKVRFLVQEEVIRPFDLSSGPLLRANLYQTTDHRWVLTFVMHHIIGDGWSMGILIKELLLFYTRKVKGEIHSPTPLKIHYKDYAAWQQEQLSGEALQRHKTYWLDHLSGPVPVLDLPADKPRPAVKTYHGGLLGRKLPSSLNLGLKKLSGQQGATLYMGLLAVVYALLHRYTRQNDIIIGSPVAGREHTDLEDQIGFYVNTIALRTQFSGKDTFTELLAKVKKVALDAFGHQALPFDELVDSLALQKDMSRNALFEVMVVLQNAGDNKAEHGDWGDLKIRGYKEVEEVISKFDLSFTFEELGEELELSIEYNSDLYLSETIDRLAGHFEQLLRTVLEQPFLSLQKLDYLSEKEKQALLISFNGQVVAYPNNKTIVELFEQQAGKTPDNIAVICEGTRLTYRELDQRSGQLAAYLKNKYGIYPDDLVGIQLDRNECTIVALLGVLKSGAGYLPIDPEYPEERIRFMLKDSRCRIVIDNDEMDLFSKESRHSEDSYHPEEKHHAGPEAVLSMSRPDHLAYVIYTSGSTGLPKGVMIDHHALMDYCLTFSGKFDLQEQDKVIHQSSISFDTHVEEIYPVLLRGGSILMGKNGGKDIMELATLIREENASIVSATPMILKELNGMDIGINKLRLLISGGDLFSASCLSNYVGRVLVYDSYGPTESTVCSTFYKIQDIRSVGVIGSPLDNRKLFILNDAEALEPIGVTGEICIGGAGLARGYLNNPVLTAEKFVANPFEKGERMYKTGDLGKWLPDGTLVFMGRKDDQIKIRGYRIEPGEIETAIRSHPEVEDVIVRAKSNKQGEQELVAYIAGKMDFQPDELAQHLQTVLPVYMLPAHYVAMDRLPLTANGKIDTSALPDPAGMPLRSGKEYVAPRNALEEKLVLIWQEILGKEKVGVKDDFFESGGHSLKAVRLVSRVQQEFDVKVALKDVYRAPTIEGMAIGLSTLLWMKEERIIEQEDADLEKLVF